MDSDEIGRILLGIAYFMFGMVATVYITSGTIISVFASDPYIRGIYTLVLILSIILFVIIVDKGKSV